MRLPAPEPGLVIRYDYVWLRERGRRQSGKERPACVVASITDEAGRPVVIIVPITHSPPSGDAIGIEIPAKVCDALGLDDARSWIIVSEYNDDGWPNAGVTPVPGRKSFIYGYLPPELFERVTRTFLACVSGKRRRGVSR